VTVTATAPQHYNVSTLLDQNLAAGHADKVAIYSHLETLTYGQLFERVCQMGALLKQFGITREQRILLLLDDTPVFPVAFFAAIRIGAVPVPVNPLYKADNYAYFVQDSYARAIVCDSSSLEKVRECREQFEPALHVLVGGVKRSQLTDREHCLDELLPAMHAQLDPLDTHPDDMAFWLYSSGSTGQPKGVVHLQHSIPYTCETYAREVLDVGAGDITFSSTKLFHAYGLGNNLSFPYWAGASSVLMSGRPTPQAVLETLTRFKPTLFFSVPTLFNSILNFDADREYDLSSVRLAASAAEALPPEVFNRFKDAYGVTILDGIGSTEMLHIYCSNQLGAQKPGSSGRAVPGYEVKAVDENGRTVGPGEAGVLYAKGESALAYYWHHQDRTREKLVGEWFCTGDRYHVDTDGFYWYEGRDDDMIKVGGLWVSPVDIENALIAHDSVVEVAAVEVKVEGLARIKTFVVPTPNNEPAKLEDDLREWCKQQLQRYQYPHYIEFLDELPKTATGKIQRFKLREFQSSSPDTALV
jgi:benzoate-CoA ligase family protein